jgi:hypothetical protein
MAMGIDVDSDSQGCSDRLEIDVQIQLKSLEAAGGLWAIPSGY